jgi:hypothetical protein
MDNQSNYKKAAAYLEELQRQVYSRLGTLPHHMRMSSDAQTGLQKDFLKRFYDQLHDTLSNSTYDEYESMILLYMKKATEACPSPFQDPWWYGLLMDMIHDIEGVLREMSETPRASYLFGSLPTGQVNAMAVQIPNNPYVLFLLEDGLFGFANLVCKAVAGVFPYRGTGEDGQASFGVSMAEIESAIAAKPDAIERFLEVLLAYIVEGNPHKARPYLPEPESAILAACLRESMEVFVLGHEFGHLIRGHIEAGRRKVALFGQTNAQQILTNWKDEFEADTTGLEILLRVQGKKGFDVSVSFWGADLFFGCIDVVEKAVQILARGRISEENEYLSETHPPTNVRRQMLRDVLRRSLPEDVASPAIVLADVVSHIMEVFWQKYEPIMHKMFSKGVKLSASWSS